MRKLRESTRFVPVLVRIVVCINLILLVTLSVLAVISRMSADAVSASSKSLSSAIVKTPLRSQSPDRDVQGLVIALRPTGLSPVEIEISDGRYLFIVQNRAGIRDLTFQLDREAGGRLHEVHDQKLQWKKQVDLRPGTYVLSVVDHPEWRCVIRVKAR